jgi:2-polyprenyl-6-methoxyphenol hydroxylase-like FAD-dependent oxidoreductase
LSPLVTPISPRYVGVALVEGTVPAGEEAAPELWSLLQGSALIALGSERTLGMGTKPDGSILFYAGMKSSEARDRQSLEAANSAEERVAWFRNNFESWGVLWESLFSKASSLVWRPLWTCPADQHWEAKPNATLIGDAAHVMPPYAGEGVNMAMLDALVLSQQLTSQKGFAQAIASYEEEMFARMQHMTDDTMRNTEMFYAPDAADQVVRLFQNFSKEAPNSSVAELEVSAVKQQ